MRKVKISVVLSVPAVKAVQGFTFDFDAARYTCGACESVKAALLARWPHARVSVDWSQLRLAHEVDAKGVAIGEVEAFLAECGVAL